MWRNPYPQRKHPHHGVIELPKKPTVVFVTVGLENRYRPVLATPVIHDLLRAIWLQADYWRVNWYMIMPDHLHFFTVLGELDFSLERWMAYWKSQYTKAHLLSTPPLETNHWDTTIRSAAHFREKWEYMRQNPVRKGLVERTEDWPYQGFVHEFMWMET